MQLNVNGQIRNIDVEPDMPLLWAIREVVGLTGTKYGCGIAVCWACTVHVNGKAEKASYRGLVGDKLHVVIPPPPGRDIVPENIPLDIVYEDEYLLVVDKAAGMVVHPAPGNWTGTLANALIGRGEPLAEPVAVACSVALAVPVADVLAGAAPQLAAAAAAASHARHGLRLDPDAGRVQSGRHAHPHGVTGQDCAGMGCCHRQDASDARRT